MNDPRSTAKLMLLLSSEDNNIGDAACEALVPRAAQLLPQMIPFLRSANDRFVQRFTTLLHQAKYPPDALLPLLHDRDPKLRVRAMDMLGDFAEPRAIPFLINALADPNDDIVESAENALKHFTPQALAPLWQAVRSDNASVRWSAANILVDKSHANPLSVLDHVRSRTVLLSAVTDPDEAMRYLAISALGDLHEARAIPILLKLLPHEHSEDIRSAIAHTFRKLNNPATAGALLTLLADDKADWSLKDGDEHPVHVEAAMALGQLHEQRAVKPMLEYLDKPLDADKPRNVDIVRAYCWALREIGDKRAIKALEELEKSDPSVRETALIALGKLGDAAILDRYLEAIAQEVTAEKTGDLSHETGDLAELLDGLTGLHDPRATQVLRQALANDNFSNDVHTHIIRQLALRQDTADVPLLVEELHRDLDRRSRHGGSENDESVSRDGRALEKSRENRSSGSHQRQRGDGLHGCHEVLARVSGGTTHFWHKGNVIGPKRPPGHCSPAPRPRIVGSVRRH